MEKVQDKAHRIISEKKPSIRERLEDAKRWAIYETEQEMASGIDVLLR